MVTGMRDRSPAGALAGSWLVQVKRLDPLGPLISSLSHAALLSPHSSTTGLYGPLFLSPDLVFASVVNSAKGIRKTHRLQGDKWRTPRISTGSLYALRETQRVEAIAARAGRGDIVSLA